MSRTCEEWLADLNEQMKKRERVAQLCAQMGPEELEKALIFAEGLKVGMISENGRA